MSGKLHYFPAVLCVLCDSPIDALVALCVPRDEAMELVAASWAGDPPCCVLASVDGGRSVAALLGAPEPVRVATALTIGVAVLTLPRGHFVVGPIALVLTIVADSFDEQDEGMLRILKMAVEGAKRNKRHSGICGQAPSDHIEVARYLVELGIDSISLTPDRVLKTTQEVYEIEVGLGRAPRVRS